MAVCIKELRLTLTGTHLEKLIGFYRDEMGLKPLEAWHSETGCGIILEVGKATLELVDEAQALSTDRLEAGASAGSTPVRFSFRVSEPGEVAYGLLRGEAILAAPPVQSSRGEAVRLQAPDGPAFSLFSAPAGPASAPDDGTMKRPGLGSIFKLLSLYK